MTSRTCGGFTVMADFPNDLFETRPPRGVREMHGGELPNTIRGRGE